MKYLDAVIESMKMLAREEDIMFLGYNVNFGSLGYGTLRDIPKNKKLETPVAESLMMGMAVGMSLEGFRPVVFFERHDFILNALDAMVNHLDKIEQLSKDQYKTPLIIRAVVGGKKPLNPGLQHIQDFTNAFREMVNFQIYEPRTPKEVIEAYENANIISKYTKKPVMVVERRDFYEQTE